MAALQMEAAQGRTGACSLKKEQANFEVKWPSRAYFQANTSMSWVRGIKRDSKRCWMSPKSAIAAGMIQVPSTITSETIPDQTEDLKQRMESWPFEK